MYDIGREHETDYLVLELLEGETLATRLERGPLPLNQVLRFGVEIADALDTAHRHHIIHRDLKPGNVALTPGGAKLLDFGLAKQPTGAAVAAQTMLATQPGTGTAQGTIVGTLQYMAPEQVQGLEADGRTDIFALGEVIYEMVSGRKAFDAQTQASLIAKILETDPPLLSTLTGVSLPELDHVVQQCLAKDPDDRWQSARDVLMELRWIQQRGVNAGPDSPQRRRGGWVSWAVAALAVVAAGASWIVRPLPIARDLPVVRFDAPLPPNMSLEDWRGWPTLSPDGRLLVVAGTEEGRQQLFVRRLDDLSFTPLAGTDAGWGPFFSPSGRSLAFFANGKLRRAEIGGGPVVVLSDAGTMGGGTWSRDGVILVGSWKAGLFRVAESGGTPEPVTKLDAARGDIHHWDPQFLPDGRTFLFTVVGRKGGIYTGSLDSTVVKRVLKEGSRGYFVEPGYRVFARQQLLMAARFDVRTLQVSGPAFPIVSGVFSVSSRQRPTAISRTGRKPRS